MSDSNRRFRRTDLQKVGTTHGLTTGCGPDRPEQVYVWRDLLDEERPVVLEGWVGYGVDSRLRLTLRQAKELLPHLIEAVTT